MTLLSRRVSRRIFGPRIDNLETQRLPFDLSNTELANYRALRFRFPLNQGMSD